jgi:hypothetical protein
MQTAGFGLCYHPKPPDAGTATSDGGGDDGGSGDAGTGDDASPAADAASE